MATPIDFAEDLLAAPQGVEPRYAIQSPFTDSENEQDPATSSADSGKLLQTPAKSAPPTHQSCNQNEWKTMINLDAATDHDRVVGLQRGGIPLYGTLPDDEDRPKLPLASLRREVKVN